MLTLVLIELIVPEVNPVVRPLLMTAMPTEGLTVAVDGLGADAPHPADDFFLVGLRTSEPGEPGEPTVRTLEPVNRRSV